MTLSSIPFNMRSYLCSRRDDIKSNCRDSKSSQTKPFFNQTSRVCSDSSAVIKVVGQLWCNKAFSK